MSSAADRRVAVPPGERGLGDRYPEERAELLVAVAVGDPHDQQIVTAAEVLLDSRVMFDELLSPPLGLDLEERPVVLAQLAPFAVALDVAPPAVDPLVDGSRREDEPAAGVLVVEHVEVDAQPLDVGVGVMVFEVGQQRLTFLDGSLDGTA